MLSDVYTPLFSRSQFFFKFEVLAQLYFTGVSIERFRSLLIGIQTASLLFILGLRDIFLSLPYFQAIPSKRLKQSAVSICPGGSVGHTLSHLRYEGGKESFEENPGRPHDRHPVRWHQNCCH